MIDVILLHYMAQLTRWGDYLWGPDLIPGTLKSKELSQGGGRKINERFERRIQCSIAGFKDVGEQIQGLESGL